MSAWKGRGRVTAEAVTSLIHLWNPPQENKFHSLEDIWQKKNILQIPEMRSHTKNNFSVISHTARMWQATVPVFVFS